MAQRKLPIPRPGARAARRAALAREYVPRYQLCSGDDPWGVGDADNTQGLAPLDDAELRSLGLNDLIPRLS